MRGWGSLTQIFAPMSFDANGHFSVDFDLPEDQQLLVVGMATVGVTGETGESLIVTSIEHLGVERLLGAGIGDLNASGVPTGVPMGHIAALGNSAFPWWPGDESALKAFLKTAMQFMTARNAEYLQNAYQKALASLRRIRNGNLDIAGFAVSEDKLKLRGTDIGIAGSDRPSGMVLNCLVLGEKRSNAPGRWAQNGPWWLAQQTIEQAQAAGTKSSTFQRIDAPVLLTGDRSQGARLVHLQTRATVYDDATLTPQSDDLALISASNQSATGTLSQFVDNDSRLSAFAGADNVVLFDRDVWDGQQNRWNVENEAALTDDSQIYLTDYLWTLAGDMNALAAS